jgi:DNA topoisomerase-3
MGKSLYIAEKPSVAREFAKALKLHTENRDGFMEASEAIVTWCVGHLVTMSYPEAYDEKLRRWSLETVPFIPEEFRYEVIAGVKKQFEIVSRLLNRDDVEMIYVCTDSGREGEYIYRLVERQAGVTGKQRRRVWIDSQTKRKSCVGSKRRRIYPITTILVRRPIYVPKKIT